MEYRKLTLEWEQKRTGKANMFSFETQMMNWFKSHFLTKILQRRGWLNGGEQGDNSIFDLPKRPPVFSFFIAVERRGSFSRFSIFSVFLWGGKKRDKCVATLQARLMVLLLLSDTASLDEAIRTPILCGSWSTGYLLRCLLSLLISTKGCIDSPCTTAMVPLPLSEPKVPYNWSP